MDVELNQQELKILAKDKGLTCLEWLLQKQLGSLRESKLPNNINPKEVVFLIDEFEMQINTLPGSGSVDSTGAMMAGGDAGGGDGGGGGGGEWYCIKFLLSNQVGNK